MEYNKAAILTTLLYSDIFDFPLKREELWEFLVSSKKISKKIFEESLKELLMQERVYYKDGYYVLAGKEYNIEKRKYNLAEVEKKQQIAKKAAYYLSHIPSVKLIGISGGLAMNDVDQQDDIDFFIIVKRNTVFTTRLWILGFLEILKLRRVHNDKNPANKICVNLIIDEAKLTWSRKLRDVYTAHEIVQLKPLFERDNIYKKFVRSNKWVSSFFPNATKLEDNYSLPFHYGIYIGFKAISILLALKLVSLLIEWAQFRYINRHKTSENISRGVLAFHPRDYRVRTLTQLSLKSHELGLLTKR